jgi:hypothetical protein
MLRSVRHPAGAAVAGFAAACMLITGIAVADAAWWGRPAPAATQATAAPVTAAATDPATAVALPEVTVDGELAPGHTVFVRFQSPLLGREAVTRVWIPSTYRAKGAPVSALYYLHGTGDLAIADRVEPPALPLPANPFTGFVGPAHGSSGGAFLEDFDVPYMVVSPDVGDPSWCGHCWWVDGRNGTGVAAESHLYRELIPVIERLFNVRRGRDGRGVSGMSMGADGALTQVFRHPDQWRFVAAFSPTLSGFAGPFWGTAHPRVIWANYLVDQGYGDDATDEVAYQNIEPSFLAQNVLGAGVGILASIGDGCLPDNQNGICADGPPYGNAYQETGFRAAMDAWAPIMTERGVDFTLVTREGNHDGTNRADSFARFFAPRIETMFSAPAPAPSTFSYRTVDTRFSVWGYDVEVERPTAEFLHLSGARADGTALMLGGTGRVTITTPALPAGMRTARVVATRDVDDHGKELVVERLAGNRLRFTVDLGTRDPAVDQHQQLVEAGRYPFPHTRISIQP